MGRIQFRPKYLWGDRQRYLQSYKPKRGRRSKERDAFYKVLGYLPYLCSNYRKASEKEREDFYKTYDKSGMPSTGESAME